MPICSLPPCISNNITHTSSVNSLDIRTWQNLVCLKVFLDVRLLCKSSATDNALERLLSRVWASMLLKVKVLGKRLVAVLALQRSRHRRRAARLRNWRLHSTLRPTNCIATFFCFHRLISMCCWNRKHKSSSSLVSHSTHRLCWGQFHPLLTYAATIAATLPFPHRSLLCASD